jgi:hypothetical protein
MEMKMAVLKSLTFTALPQVGANPIIDRRSRVIERLEEQKRLIADPNHKRTIRTTIKKDGEKTTVEKQHRVLPWWRMTQNGSYVFFIKASQKPVEFEKGKAAIRRATDRIGHRSNQCFRTHRLSRNADYRSSSTIGNVRLTIDRLDVGIYRLRKLDRVRRSADTQNVR